MTYSQRHPTHWSPSGQNIFITWRLHDSLPAKVRPPASIESSGKVFVHYDHILDKARTGPVWLKDARIANCVLVALNSAQQRKMFTAQAYVLMANHVHLLLAPQTKLSRIMQQIKGATAREANLILGRTGKPFWQDESFDHWIRDPAECQKVRTYIEQNPVAAGLVNRPEDWPWSSASHPIG
jgi:REP element-mobilizing transposase RayT